MSQSRWQVKTGLVTWEASDDMGNLHYNLTGNNFETYYGEETSPENFTKAEPEDTEQATQGTGEDNTYQQVPNNWGCQSSI